MKKVIIAILILLTIPNFASATKQWYSDAEQQRIDKRIDDLEKQNSRLQIQISNLSPESIYDHENRISGLEKRMQAVEQAVVFLQRNVMQALQTIIGTIQKLVK